MSKAKAIAVPFNPFLAAAISAKNTFKLMGDVMYSTRERANGTLCVAFLMIVLSALLQHTAANVAMVCGA